VLNYYPLLSTEGPEKQQQTGLLLGSSEYSNRQQYVSTHLRNLLQNLLLAKRTRPLPVPDSTLTLLRQPHRTIFGWKCRLLYLAVAGLPVCNWLAWRACCSGGEPDYRCTARKGPFCICGDVPT
jgi:hypothetical protein